jgi:pyruvate,water dikinase
MPDRYVVPLRHTKAPDELGNKARQLSFLMQQRCAVPPTWVVTYRAHARYLEQPADPQVALRAELAAQLDPTRSYAVRSSASVEDTADRSFAGQFSTVLDVQGIDDVLDAIRRVWQSAQSPAVQAYRSQQAAPLDTVLRMAVIVQQMVPAVAAGVAFSQNPLTGLDEVVVEAVPGRGDALVQDGVTPQRWVNKWGEWLHTPSQPSVPLAVIQEVVARTRRLAKAFGRPVDLEWVYDGSMVFWLQLREITARDQVTIYSNRIAREVLPGLIKPLVWSINVPMVNSAWVRFFGEVIGPNDIDPHALARSFYYRAYFNMSVVGDIFEALGFPRASLELLIGLGNRGSEKPRFKPTRRTYTHVPRMLRFVADKWRFDRRVEEFLPAMWEQYRALQSKDIAYLREGELLPAIGQLKVLGEETAYFNIVVPLLMQAYHGVLRSQLAGCGIDLDDVDLTADLPALEALDPNAFLARLQAQYARLSDEARQSIRDGGYDDFVAMPGVGELQQGVDEFLTRFGHFSDSGNDFSSTPWRASPDIVLRMVADFQTVAADGPARADFDALRLPAVRRPWLRVLAGRARRFRLYREQISSLFTFGYGLLRDYFLALGAHFVQRGLLAQPDDIYFLSWDEVVAAVQHATPGASLAEQAATRRQDMETVRHVVLPEVIYGDAPPPLEARVFTQLTGVPTARGYYQGPVRVVQGIHDFAKVCPGDVLVIPFSDVGWTPLFAKAGAVIAESGGMLSHSSIIAREYRIPAVVSVAGALQLADNTRVTVDGYRGEVVIHQGVVQE